MMKDIDFDRWIDCKAAIDKFQHKYNLLCKKCREKGVSIYQDNLVLGLVAYSLSELIIENYFIVRVSLFIDLENSGNFIGELADNYIDLFRAIALYLKKINDDEIFVHTVDYQIIRIKRNLDEYYKLVREWLIENVYNTDFDVHKFMIGKYNITYN